MSSYFDLIKRRLEDFHSGPTTTVEILVDHENYAQLREAWVEAQREVSLAQGRLDLAKDDNNIPNRRMNQPSPAKAAQEGLDTAIQAEKQARDAVQACFIRVHLSAPSGGMMAEVAAKAGADQALIYDLLVRRCVAKVTSTDGAPLNDLTADVIADYLAVAPVGERMKVNRALDQASTPVDFPMSRGS